MINITNLIEVIYENGVLKPLKKIKLKEGEILRIEIKDTKKISKGFYNKLLELKNRVNKTDDAHKVLEELRNVSY